MYDPQKPRILVALGGRSHERPISIASGAAVATALEKLGYPSGILDTGTGKLMQSPELKNIEQDPQKLSSSFSFPLIDIKRHFELVFICLHGRYGEDGGFQALMEEIGMPYTGSTPPSSAAGLNKKFSKIIFETYGVPTPAFQIISKPNEKMRLKYPVVVKPVAQGSSLGVSICENESDYQLGIKRALEFDGEAIVEPYTEGREITVAILENKNGTVDALPIVEIKPATRFFDFNAKYDPKTIEEVPAKNIDDRMQKQIVDTAIKAYKALDCRHLARVDMIIDKKNKLQVLEVNTLPGMTANSLVPKAARAAGISFEELVDHLVKIALKQSAISKKTVLK